VRSRVVQRKQKFMPFKRLSNPYHVPSRPYLWLRTLFACLILMFLLSPSAQAQSLKPVMLTNETSTLSLKQMVLVQKDPQRRITESRLRDTQGGALSGKISEEDVIDLGSDGVSTWLSFKMLNNSDREDWILDMGGLLDGRFGRIRAITVYEMPLRSPLMPDATPTFYLKEILGLTRSGTYKIGIGKGEQKLIVIHAEPGKFIPASLPLRIYSEPEFIANLKLQSFYATFLCVLSLLSVFGFWVLTFIRRKRWHRANKFNMNVDDEALDLNDLKETKDTADHTRLLKVIEKEREALAEMRLKESSRIAHLREAKEAADEANRAKSAFLAVVSHEIRTPMTGIMGMVRLLLDSGINKQQKDYVMTIQESGDSMLGLLNDILDFEKIQRGKIDLENISFDLHRLIQGIITLLSGHAAQKGIALSARMDDDLPRFVKGDPTRLRQVLLNLMGNSIKFTDKGSVTLFVKTMKGPDETSSDSSDRFVVYFGIQDTGMGISEEKQQNLFAPFSQADSTITRKFGGTGLGLAISKGLVEAMNSSININSKENEGSTFFFTLEMERGIPLLQQQDSNQSGAATDNTKPIKPLRIMVVDDNAINHKVIGGFLEQDGHLLTQVTSAEEAFTKLERQNFDVILMDIQLPGMSGDEATAKLRDLPNPKIANLPVIALTGNVEREQMERYLAMGMNAILPKPIDPDKLRHMIGEVSTHSYERQIVPPAPQEPAPAKKAHHNIFNSSMLQTIKDSIGGEQLDELLSELLTKANEIIADMDIALKNADMTALSARAHELKGMAGNFGLIEMTAIVTTIESKTKANEIDGLEGLINDLPASSERAKAALQEWQAV
jgi:TMAO reductase system sensor TorS